MELDSETTYWICWSFQWSLNPCFNGTGFRAKCSNLKSTCSGCLNPCFNGTGFRERFRKKFLLLLSCLNPCFNGTGFRELFEKKAHNSGLYRHFPFHFSIHKISKNRVYHQEITNNIYLSDFSQTSHHAPRLVWRVFLLVFGVIQCHAKSG